MSGLPAVVAHTMGNGVWGSNPPLAPPHPFASIGDRGRQEDAGVTYDDIAAHFLVPGPDPIPTPLVQATPARRLRDAIEPIATIGWWSREAAAGSTALGVDFFGGYVWGRAASLGSDVEPAIVVSSFGVFDASLLTAVLAGARTLAPHDDILTARAAGAAAGLSNATRTVPAERVGWFGDRLLPALAEVDAAARPLFAALRAQPVPDDVHGRAWRAAELVREHRGDGHLAACVAAGLSAVEMNVLTEVWLGFAVGDYSSTRGFGPDQLRSAVAALCERGWMDADGSLSSEGQVARDAIEAATDRSQDALVASLGVDLDEVVAVGEEIGRAILAAHAAPADPRKRAAG